MLLMTRTRAQALLWHLGPFFRVLPLLHSLPPLTGGTDLLNLPLPTGRLPGRLPLLFELAMVVKTAEKSNSTSRLHAITNATSSLNLKKGKRSSRTFLQPAT